MKELLKIISKRMFLWSVIVNVVYSLADYGGIFALSIFGTSPLTLDKVIKLSVILIISYIVMLIVGKLASYIDNINCIKSQNEIQRYYFTRMQSMTLEKISNTHTGYISKLINKVCDLFFNTIWEIESSIISTIIGAISILYMVCKQSIYTGIICVSISVLAVYLKYKMLKNKQKYQKEFNEADSRYNGLFIDFVQNITTVRKLNINNFCNDKLENGANEFLDATKVNEKKRSMTNLVFTGLMYCLYFVVLVSTIIMVSKGYDGLPYLLFYLPALGKLYSNLNGFVRFLDYNERFNTTKKQLDEYFKDSKNISLINNFKNLRLSEVIFSYNDEST